MRPGKFFKVLRQEFEVIHFKGCHFPKEIILMAIRWYIAYLLSYRHVEELMEERGLKLDHATVNRWVVKYSPTLESKFRQFKKPIGKSWRMDECKKSIRQFLGALIHCLRQRALVASD